MFRELLQNSDDAQATAVEIRFETQTFLDGRNAKKLQDEPPQFLPDLNTTLVC